MVVLVYVNDLVITRNDEVMIQELKHNLHQNFKMKDLGNLKFFLGIEVLRSEERILLNQRKYALELINNTYLGGVKLALTPLEQNLKLTTSEFDKGLSQESDGELMEDKTVFQILIGRLIYLTNTRPDITYAVHHLSQFMHQPKKSHMDAALRIVKYVKNEPGLGLFLESSANYKITAYCDADWASWPMSIRSIIGLYIKIGSSLV